MRDFKTFPNLLMKQILLLASGLVGLLISIQSSAAAIEAIEFNPLDEDQFEVVLFMNDSSYEDPQVFAIEQPARLVMDLPGTENLVTEKRFALSLANAENAVLLASDDRTRLVLNLVNPVSYETILETDVVRLIVGSNSSSTSSSDTFNQSSLAKASSSGSESADATRIVDLDFRRGEQGEGNLVFEFDSADLNADVSLNGSTIEVRFYGAELDEAIQRVFDVQDFATPVKSFSAEYLGNESRIEIETLDAFDYLAYQTDSSYVISVKPIDRTSNLNREPEFAFTGEKLSLNFQNIEVRAVLQLIADFTDLNLVASDTVTGSITLRLENVPWDQALEIVLKAKGLDQRREGNVLLVAPIAEIAERERLEVEANKQLEELAPLITEYIRVRYADAESIFGLLSGEGTAGGGGSDGQDNQAGLLSDRGSAIVDARTNTIILTDTAEHVSSFVELIEQLDIPIRQVLIEARIVIANTNFRRELGVRWGGTGVRALDGGTNLVQYGGNSATVQGTAANLFNGTGTFTANPLAVDLGVAAATSQFAVSFLTDSSFVELELSALENEGYGEVISQPKVVTGDKQTASIKSGSEVAFQEAAASGATTTAFKEAVLELNVTPQITPDDRVILDLRVTQDSIGTQVFGGEPTIDVTELETQVLVDDGQTLVLGGIFRSNSTDSINKVPFLGDIPFVGRAFQNKLVNQTKQEVLIFITPKILSDNIGVK